MNDSLEDILYSDSVFGGDKRRVLSLDADDIFYFVDNPLGLGAGKVDFVDNRENIKVMVKRKINIGKGLSLYSLSGVNDKYRSVAGSKRS